MPDAWSNHDKEQELDSYFKTLLWKQYGAALDMYADVIDLCPDHLWTATVYQDEEDARFGQFWFIAYHTLFWADLFLTGSSEGFLPPAPFVRGRLPDQPYPKSAVVSYRDQIRSKAKSTFDALTEESAFRLCKFDWMEPSYYELQLYCMRHIQEHASQLSLLLGQHNISGMDWVAHAREHAS